MALYRVYVPVPDEWGNTVTQRVGHTFGSIHKALKACEKASLRYGVAELKDDSRSIYDRLLSVFRNGREVVQRPQF